MAHDWDDIESVSSYNSVFRRRISKIIGMRLTDVNKMSKKQIKDFLLSNPNVFNDFLKDWDERNHVSYNINVDVKGIMEKNKKIFITYSWESQEHKDWV